MARKFVLKIGLITCLILILFELIGSHNLQAIPSGFQLIETGKGIEVYSDLEGNYIQIIDLTENAGIVFLQGKEVGDGVPAAYGGINPQFQRQSLSVFWQDLVQRYGNRAFSVCNGQFF
jgi:hypothetical protein